MVGCGERQGCSQWEGGLALSQGTLVWQIYQSYQNLNLPHEARPNQSWE